VVARGQAAKRASVQLLHDLADGLSLGVLAVEQGVEGHGIDVGLHGLAHDPGQFVRRQCLGLPDGPVQLPARLTRLGGAVAKSSLLACSGGDRHGSK
jgi:hypothetical protein